MALPGLGWLPMALLLCGFGLPRGLTVMDNGNCPRSDLDRVRAPKQALIERFSR